MNRTRTFQKALSFALFFILSGSLFIMNASASTVQQTITIKNNTSYFTRLMYTQQEDTIAMNTDGKLRVTMPYGTNTQSIIKGRLMGTGGMSSISYATIQVFNGNYQYFSQPNATYSIRTTYTFSNDLIPSDGEIFFEFYDGILGSQFKGITEQFNGTFSPATTVSPW